MDCESPCYNFEWKGGQLVEALCETCGNDNLDEFATEEDFEALTGG